MSQTAMPGMPRRAPVVVISIGNPSRGDDAIGAVLHEWLDGLLIRKGWTARVELLEDFQLQLEHAIDLRERALALVIDAGDHTPAPLQLYREVPTTAVAHTSHALSPGAVLQVFGLIEKADPPPTFVLCVRGEAFGLGDPMGAAATAHVEVAKMVLEQLLANPEVSAWTRLAETFTPPRDVPRTGGPA